MEQQICVNLPKKVKVSCGCEMCDCGNVTDAESKGYDTGYNDGIDAVVEALKEAGISIVAK